MAFLTLSFVQQRPTQAAVALLVLEGGLPAHLNLLQGVPVLSFNVVLVGLSCCIPLLVFVPVSLLGLSILSLLGLGILSLLGLGILSLLGLGILSLLYLSILSLLSLFILSLLSLCILPFLGLGVLPLVSLGLAGFVPRSNHIQLGVVREGVGGVDVFVGDLAPKLLMHFSALLDLVLDS